MIMERGFPVKRRRERQQRRWSFDVTGDLKVTGLQTSNIWPMKKRNSNIEAW
uniref:Uncharacterized protein n=1 Tax=Arion vulgaris TaxID=1028688 RepID=A0A0B6YCK5_9EUPU